jgi:phosphate-selective porin OprO/OprP
MRFDRRKFYRNSSLVVIALLFPLVSVRGQTVKEQPATLSNRKQPDAKQEEKGEGIEELKSKVEQLQSLVEQQQRVLEQLQKRLDENEGKARNAALVTPKPDATVEPRTAAPEVNQAPKSGPPPGQDKKPVIQAGWNDRHAFLRSEDGSFDTVLTGYAQFDFRGYQSGNHPPNTFLARRARLSFEGKLARYYDFKVEGDFADTTSTLLRDFFINIHRVDEFQVRFGQFKEPFSQEELRSDANQDFVERSLVNNLAPSRSPGLMVSGSLNKGVFEYYVGAFNGKGLLAANNNGTPETAFRVRFAPGRNTKSYWGKGIAFGGAFAQGRTFGGTSVRGQTESRSFTFYAPDTVNGKIVRANGEVTWLIGPASIRAEYDQTNQDRDNLGPGGSNLPGVVAKGYVAQATYLLTRENKPDGNRADDPVVPRHSLFSNEGGSHGFGAWELKFRYANLQLSNGTAKANRAETFFFGPNWYLNRFVRYVLDLGVERYKDPLRSPNPADKNYFVVLSRIQVAF